MTRGRFITLEGGEGAGKSTQAVLLADALRAGGVTVVQTREPGGSAGAEALRELVVSGDQDRWSPISEALIMFAARADHLERTIRPALGGGAWVICDRFSDSSRAYQGGGGGVEPDFIEALDQAVVGSDQPDLTLVFDLPVDVGLARAVARDGAHQRFEGKGEAFHQRLRSAFTEIVREHPERCVLIDAQGDIDTVAGRIWSVVKDRLL